MQTLQPSFLKRSWPYLLLMALVVLFLGDVWFGGRMLLLRDFFFGTETQFLSIGKALRHGTFPLWSSSVQCGIPFAASPYHSAFYLPNWLFILPSAELATRLLWTFHLALAAISFFALARYWRMGVVPALFGAVSFAFCTFTVTWLEFSLSITWALVALLLVSRLIDTTAEEVFQNAEAKTPLRLWPIFLRNAASIVGLAVTFALLLAATGEFFYYSALLLAAYGVARWTWHGSWKVCAISLLWLGGAGLLTLALAAPQLFLTMELVGFSERAGEVDSAANMASAHPRQWLAFLLPYLYGRPGYPNAYWAPTIYEFGIGHCYVGILPLLASFFCWLRSKGAALSREAREWRFLTWFFSAVLLGGMLMVAGKYTPVYGFLHHWLPGLGHFRFPVKFYFFVALALSMLGALGLQSLLVASEKNEDRSRIRLWKIALGIFGVFLMGYLVCLLSDSFLPWLMAHPTTPSVAQISDAMADYTWAVVFTLLGLGLFALLAFRRGPTRWVQAGIVAVAFLNMCVVSRQTQPTGPAGIYTRRPEALAKRIGTDPMYRYFSTYYSAQQYLYGDERPEMWEWAIDAAATNHLLQEGLCSLTPGGLSVTRYSQIFGAIMSAPRPIGEKFADMLSMRYIIGGAPFDQILWGNAPREVRIGERPTSLPRAFVVSQWLPVTDGTAALQTIASDSFDPHKVAVVEPLVGETVPPSNPASASSESAGKVRAFADHGNSVTMEVEAKRNALLVLGDTFYPGWSVRVDSIKRPIFQTNYLFRGVFLEPGTHQVEFIFTPTNFTLGLWICALAAAICGVLAWMSRRFRQ